MATTPPPMRLRTPPTPLHGPRYDSFEPFSPRRSSRISERQPLTSDSTSTPASKARAHHRERGIAMSPLSSPVSSPKRKRGVTFADSDDEDLGHHDDGLALPRSRPSASSHKTHLNPFISASTSINDATMLPTPSKTPRTKRVASPSALKSTARVLFPTSDIMPEPRSARKSRKMKNAFTLTDEDSDNESAKIEIYTDIKEREPEKDESDDNPFIGKRKTRSSTRKGGLFGESNEQKSDELKKMEEAVARDEGLIYVFRGKKVFRRFDTPRQSSGESFSSQDSIKRQVGGSAKKHFTRSTIKPRLLWPSEHDDVDPEEALTDIEIEGSSSLHFPALTPKTKRRAHIHVETEQTSSTSIDEAAVYGIAPHMIPLPATPPSTKKRNRKRDTDKVPEIFSEEEAQTPASAHFAHPGLKRQPSVFDTWRRTKKTSSSSSESLGTGTNKRAASPMEKGDGKRVRSGH